MSDHVLDQVAGATSAEAPRNVGWGRASWRQYRLERRMFWRNPSAAFFNFLLPLLFLGLFGAVFSGNDANLQVIVPGIAGMSVMSTTFSALAMNLTYLRESGVLKRIHGTPLPTSAYLAGIFGNAVTNTAIQIAIVTTVGATVFGLDWPPDPAALVVFVVVGVCCFAAMGVALSHLIPNFDSAPAYVNAVFLPMIFISGVFFDADDAPAVPARHRGGAAAQAPDRRAVGGDGHRRGGRGQLGGADRAGDLDRGRDRAGRSRVLLGGAAGLSAEFDVQHCLGAQRRTRSRATPEFDIEHSLGARRRTPARRA